MCPRKELYLAGGKRIFEKGYSFSSPYKHLKRCLSEGNEEHFIKLFRQSCDEKRRFRTSRNEQIANYIYIRIIFLNSLPVTYFKDLIVRNFSRFETKFGYNYLKSVLARFTQLEEERISRVMNGTKGAIVHDGWTNSEIHYYDVFASFMRKVQFVHDCVEHELEEWRMPLLTVSPLSKELISGR